MGRRAIRIEHVDPTEHGETFLDFYARNPADATPHPKAVLEEGECELWLAYAGDEAVGGILTREMRTSDGQLRGGLDNLIVDGSWRGLGIGRRLIETVEEHFRERGLFGMQTGGNPDNPVSIPLYERLGFRTVRRYRRARDGAARIHMWKDFGARPSGR